MLGASLALCLLTALAILGAGTALAPDLWAREVPAIGVALLRPLPTTPPWGSSRVARLEGRR